MSDVDWILIEQAVRDFFVSQAEILSEIREGNLDYKVTKTNGEQTIHLMRHQVARRYPRRERSGQKALVNESKLLIYPVAAAAAYDLLKDWFSRSESEGDKVEDRYISAEEFPQMLLEMREASGLTRHELSKISGLSLSTIERLEAGGPFPRTDVIQRYAKACGHNLALKLSRD